MAEGVAAASAPRRFGWYYGWTIVGLAVLAQMMTIGLVVNCFSLFLLDWRSEFHAPISTFQLAMTMFALLCTPFSAVAGWAADRFPIRLVLSFGLLLVAGAQVAVGFATSPWMVVASYALVGFGLPFASSVPAQALVSRWFVKRRGLALGISAFGIASAGVVFPPIIGLLMHAFGWRMTWRLFAGFIAVAIVPLMLFAVRDRPDPDDASGYVTGAGRQEAGEAPQMTYLEIVTRPNFWIIGLPFVLVFGAYMGVVGNLPPMVKSHGMDAKSAVVLLSAVGLTDLVGKVLCGFATDRFGNRAPMVALCLLAAAAAAGLAFGGAHSVLIASLLAIGLVGGVWTVVASATAVEFGRENFGRAYGLIHAFSPATTVMPWVIARSQEWNGSYTPGLIGLTTLSLIASGLYMMLREKKPAGRGAAADPA
jgi:MFS family permease